jgi:hypothetical protein
MGDRPGEDPMAVAIAEQREQGAGIGLGETAFELPMGGAGRRAGKGAGKGDWWGLGEGMRGRDVGGQVGYGVGHADWGAWRYKWRHRGMGAWLGYFPKQ